MVTGGAARSCHHARSRSSGSHTRNLSICVRIVRVNTLSELIARPDILGNKAQKNAVMMPRRMSAHDTSMRTQSIVAASDCEAIFFNSEAGDDDRAFPASTALHATREDRLGSLPFRSRRTETKEPPLDPSGSKNKSIFLTWPGSTARVMPQAG